MSVIEVKRQRLTTGYIYAVRVKGDCVASDPIKSVAEEKAQQVLADAYTYHTASSQVRVAKDGSIMVFRQLTEDHGMYEFKRQRDSDDSQWNASHSSCMGGMTDGITKFRRLSDWADYVVGEYNTGCSI